MSWPSDEDLNRILAHAQSVSSAAMIEVKSEIVVYLIENLRRLNKEIASSADRSDAIIEELHRQKRRAKRWKRRYTALANQKDVTHE